FHCNGLVDCGVYYGSGSYPLGGSTIGYAAFEWHNVTFYSEENQAFNFEVVLYSDGRVDFNYGSMAGRLDGDGNEVTIGIQEEASANFILYMQGGNTDLNGRTVRFYPPGVAEN